MSDISILKKALQATKMTFAQAEEKVKAEASKQRVNRFRINSDGEYNIRICPLVPVIDADGNPQEMDRIGYEYPLHQQFLKIEIPAKKKGGKSSFTTIPVIRATDAGVGFSVDLIDEYVKIAKEYGDDEVTKKITSGSFEGGLRWGYQHAMYVIDMEKRKDGIQIFQISQAQYRALEEAKMSVWKDLREDDPDCSCPISDFESAYQVRINRKTENKKTDYTFTVNTVKKPVALTDEELDKLISMDRIPAEIYRYTRYQMEATIEFLKQYDEKLQIDVCEQDDFKAVVDKLKGELPSDDTSHFNPSDAKSGDGKKGNEEITIDSLWAEADALADAGLGRGSDEYAELREKIREFTAEHNIDIRLSASKSNEELLEDIEELMNDSKKKPAKSEEVAEQAEETHDDAEETPAATEEPEDKPEPAPRRRRAPRPSDDVAEQPAEEIEQPAEDEEKPAEEAPAPRRRRR